MVCKTNVGYLKCIVKIKKKRNDLFNSFFFISFHAASHEEAKSNTLTHGIRCATQVKDL